MDSFVGRQVILDRKRDVYGYELLFRAHAASLTSGLDSVGLDSGTNIGVEGRGAPQPSSSQRPDASTATMHVLSSSLLSLGLANLVGSARAFVNFEREMLLTDWYSALPPETAVIEILETVEPDDDVLAACRKMRAAGYQIALDDFEARPEYEPLLDLCHLVKVEIGGHSRKAQEAMVAAYHDRGLTVLAEKVETYEEFRWAHKIGYDYFQGYFFARPEVLHQREVGAQKMNCLRLLRESQRPELDYQQLERIIASEVSFAYKLLRYVNSALLGGRKEIQSVKQALFFLGSNALRKWVAMAALPGMADNKPAELVMHSLTRAQMCQSLAEPARIHNQGTIFLMGLFSLLDALMDRPLEQTLADIGLGSDLSAVLLGTASETDPVDRLYRLVLSYEKADWESVALLSQQLNIEPEKVSHAYVEALNWAREAMFAVSK